MSASKKLTDFEKLASRVYEELAARPRVALKLANRGVEIARNEKLPTCLAKMTLCRAHALRESGRQSEALRDYERAANLYRQNGEIAEAWRTIIGKIDALDQLGQYAKALREAKSAGQFFKKHHLPIWEAKIYANTGNIYQHLDRYNLALRYYQRAYEVLSSERPLDAHVALFNRANLHLLTGDPDAALTLLEKCRDFFGRENLSHFLGSTHYNLAYAFYLLGKYQDSLSQISNARVIFQGLKDKPFLASCFLDEAELYSRLNRTEEAIGMAQKARREFQRLKMPYEQAESSALLGISLIKTGRLKPGIGLLQEAVKFFQKQRNEIKSAEIDSHIALAFVKQNRFGDAEKYLRRAQTIFARHHLYPRMLSASIYIAGLRYQKQDYAGAYQILNRAGKSISRVQLPWVLIPYYQLLGKVLAKMDRRAEASSTLKKAIHLVESIRSEIPAEDLRISFFQDKLDAFNTLIQLGLSEQTASGITHAFLIAERARSRVLQDLLEGSLEFREQPAQLSALLGQIETDSWRRSVEQASGVRPAHQTRITTLLRKSQAVKRNIKSSELSLRQIQSVLETDQSFVCYYATGDDLHAFVVQSNQISAHSGIAQMKDIRDRWQLLRFQMERARIDRSASEQECESHLRSLGESLISPLIQSIGKTRTLTIIPFGFLHELPFHCLKDKAGYFSERYLFSYAPSASVYRHCVRRKSSSNGKLLIGYSDELAPWINTEIAEIRAVFPDALTAIGDQARIQVLQQSNQAGVIHIASHGRFQKNAPLLSGILLRDGWLTIPQIYQLKLKADLITLSGCETGSHEISAGEELLGLMRAFLYAGAASLLVSLWRVSDNSTAFFMKEFYTALSSGRRKMEAWQSALLRTKEKWPHPFYWGPFLLIGKPF